MKFVARFTLSDQPLRSTWYPLPEHAVLACATAEGYPVLERIVKGNGCVEVDYGNSGQDYENNRHDSTSFLLYYYYTANI
jgi:hypothetical protein